MSFYPCSLWDLFGNGSAQELLKLLDTLKHLKIKVNSIFESPNLTLQNKILIFSQNPTEIVIFSNFVNIPIQKKGLKRLNCICSL